MVLRPFVLALCALCATPALAQSLEEKATAYLQKHGFAGIELIRENGMLVATATNDGRRIEVNWDASTGEILSQEMTTEAPAARTEVMPQDITPEGAESEPSAG